MAQIYITIISRTFLAHTRNCVSNRRGHANEKGSWLADKDELEDAVKQARKGVAHSPVIPLAGIE